MSTTPHTDLVIVITVPYSPDHEPNVRVYDNDGYNDLRDATLSWAKVGAVVDMIDPTSGLLQAVLNKRDQARTILAARIESCERAASEIPALRAKMEELGT